MRACSSSGGRSISSLARSFGEKDNSVVAPRRSTSIFGRNISLDRIANSAPPVALGPRPNDDDVPARDCACRLFPDEAKFQQCAATGNEDVVVRRTA